MTVKKWVTAALVFILIGIIGTSVYGFQFGDQREAYSKRWEFQNDQLQRLILDAHFDGGIRFIESSDANGYIEVNGKWDPATVESFKKAALSNGTFVLSDTEQASFQFFNLYWEDLKSTMTVALPAGHHLNEVKISSSSSDIELQGLNAQTLELDNTSGSVGLKDIHAPNIRLDLTSGDIKASGIQGDVDVSQTSGSLRIEGLTGDLHSSIQSGDTRVTELHGTANVQFTSGNVDIEQATAGSIDVSGQSGDVRIQAAADFAGVYDTRATSGDITTPDSPMTSSDVIKVRTTSGNIKITQ